MTSLLPRIDSGTIVGPYVIERRLGRNGSSTLFRARDADGTLVVLKMLKPEVATTAARARLLREARALSAIEHPSIARIYATGEHGGVPWIAMDPVAGTDLRRFVSDRGPLPVELALRFAIQVTEALETAHGAGAIHRDLSPATVLIGPDGRALVIDFGLTRRRPEAREGEADALPGDPATATANLAPEQIEHGLADERSDVWALGCLLYEMMVGSPPFGRGGPATATAILQSEPAFPPWFPAGVRHVVTACLRKSSFARLTSAREVLVLLRDALEPSRDEVESPAERWGAAGASERPLPPGRPSSVRPASRPSGLGSAAPPPPPLERTSRPPSLAPIHSSKQPPSATRIAVGRGCIKGTAVRAMVTWFVDAYGQDAMAQTAQLASHELRDHLHLGDSPIGIMASAWYETPLLGELLELFERVAAPVDPSAFSSRLAEAVARDNVAGVYRALFRLIATPPLLEANAHRVWQTYVDEGTLGVRLREPNVLDARIRGWSRHHPAVCRTIRPGIEHVLRAIGYKAPAVTRTACVALGDGVCSFEVKWSS